MPDGSNEYTARTVSSVHEIGAQNWNALANISSQSYNPFASFEYLSALEDSKSVAAETGWVPLHLVLEEAESIVGIAPLYVKGHSQGEYVFDYHWADAFERAGGNYYPKLLSGIPFTPVAGPRLLAAPSHKINLASALQQVTEQLGTSSLHVNFLSKEDADALSLTGFLPRLGEQFHWFNRGYKNFDEFLGVLSSRKRKAIRRERREAVNDITIRQLVGYEVTEHYWDSFWQFYQDTAARKWGQPYLTRTFFRLISERMNEQLLMIVAERDGRPVAGALNFIGGDALYGRYWGCTEDIPFLHFELCYHQAIDFAIQHDLSRVEAGAQGDHKIARGYEPIATWSAHWIVDAGFRKAIAQYLEAEKQQTSDQIAALSNFTPFKKTD